MRISKKVITKERLEQAIDYFAGIIKEVDDFFIKEKMSEELRKQCEEMKTHYSVAFLVLDSAMRELYGEEK